MRGDAASALQLTAEAGEPHGSAIPRCYTIHMKRTNLVLDERLLEEAVRVLGVKTYSAAVNEALKEAIRVKKAHRLRELFGSDIWEGNLSEMREDRPAPMASSVGGKR